MSNEEAMTHAEQNRAPQTLDLLSHLDYDTAYTPDEIVAIVGKDARKQILPLLLTGYLELGRDRKIRKVRVAWGDMQQ